MHNETKKIKNTTAEVTELLRIYPEYRDNDERLVAQFWYKQIKEAGKTVDLMTGRDFLADYSKGLLTSGDCIVRARANAQRQHPELRGATWAERHKIANSVTKEIYKNEAS